MDCWAAGSHNTIPKEVREKAVEFGNIKDAPSPQQQPGEDTGWGEDGDSVIHLHHLEMRGGIPTHRMTFFVLGTG